MISVLFARRNSIYKAIPGLDVWDIERNAENWPGGNPVIAHPPCRAWGILRHFSKHPPGEPDLALQAVAHVRTWGGVLEHPEKSLLWKNAGLPKQGEWDAFGGWTLSLLQYWFGHRAEKGTWLYIVGINPGELPPIPFVLGEPEFVVATRKKKDKRKEISKAEREETPVEFALWLVDVAKKIENKKQKGKGYVGN